MSSDDSRSAENMAAARTTMIAAAWFARMQSDERTPEDAGRFRDWLASDPENEAAYASISDMWEAADGIAETPGIQAMRFDALQRRPGGLRLLGSARRRAAATVAALAASLILVLGVVLYGTSWSDWSGHRAYQTAPGQRMSIVLADGTLVSLTSSSRLVADFSADRRRVRLERGEAFFDVMHDPRRPFVVEANSGSVTALGTTFDVFKKNGEVVVTLIEGRVKVAAVATQHTEEKTVELRAGEQVSYEKGALSEVREVDIARTVSWRGGRLRVLNEPLGQVVDELNRHSKRKLHLDSRDSRIRAIPISGSFSTDRPEQIVAHLQNAGYRVWTVQDSSGNITLKLLGKTSR